MTPRPGREGGSARKRNYVIGGILALFLVAAIAGYFYLIWLARVVERITD